MSVTGVPPRTDRAELEATLAAAGIGVWEWIPATGEVRWNEALEQNFGLEPGTFAGTLDAYSERIHPDDRDQHLDMVRAAAEDGTSFRYRCRIVMPDKTTRWLEGTGRPVRDETTGELTAFVGICGDATDQVVLERRLADESRELRRVVDTLRSSMLPPTQPGIPGCQVAAAYRPGDRHLSGDFYDVFPLRGKDWAVVLGDVCGKGPGAASRTALVRFSLRAAGMAASSVTGAMEIVNRALVDDPTETRFCTAIYARLRPNRGRVEARLASAGHPAPLIRRDNGQVELVKTSGRLLGVFDHVDAAEVSVDLHEGDLLVLYTDGATDARSGTEFFGLNRLVGLLERTGGMDAVATVDSIYQAIERFDDGDVPDDLAILALGPLAAVTG